MEPEKDPEAEKIEVAYEPLPSAPAPNLPSNAYPYYNPNLPPGNVYQPPPPVYLPQNYPPQGYPPQGYPPQSYPPQPYPSQSYPQQSYPPQPYPGNSPNKHHHKHSSFQFISSSHSVETFCPHCKKNVNTKVEKRAGTGAWVICLILLFFCFPFCIYPLICNPCLDIYHICSNCNHIVGGKKLF